jgi:hypothetical protein
VIVYTPLGRPLTVRMDAVRGPTARAWWFDPRTGEATRLGDYPAAGTRVFDPPGEARRGNDWVLVLDGSGTHYPPPGVAAR